ncbi:three-prime repair exonuclease 1-like [Colias croceus]|uniref:three-prime repair exonuclease 1-like n=1 Tax=Colias crocea TaxID=72248 RepID=UPI001E27C72A|nr:three-prime repair exonuclease 1-like [Colias croceus]
MTRVATYVFIDFETTSLPKEDHNRTRITELSFIAVKRAHILDTEIGDAPRVQQKVTLCLYPGRMICPTSTKITKLSNELLEHETKFNDNVYNILNTFLNILTKPVCLVAQNGLRFDFPILKNHLDKLGKCFPEDLLCADSYHCFFDILECPEDNNTINMNNQSTTSIDKTFLEENLLQKNTLEMKSINESTPKRRINNGRMEPVNREKLKRRFVWSDGERPKKGYKLGQIYEKLLKTPSIDAHQAEADSFMTLKCAVAVKNKFVDWVDNNFLHFSDIKPMTIGIPIGE